MRRVGVVVTGLMLAVVARAADVPAELKTRAEISNFEETSRAGDVDRVLAGLAAASPSVTVTTFGRSEEGRPLPLAILSTPAVADPAAARRSGRPRVLVLANIHAGEVEGKEAALIIARRLAVGDLRSLLSRLVVIVAPLYNADGNERISLDHRPAQFGPLGGVGIRENANGLDLNRDFTKLEASESRALVKLLIDWDPHVVIDLHTTNGSYHGFHLTYAPTLAVGADPRLVAYTRDTLLASAAQVMANRGWRTYYYGNFTTEGQLDREQERPAGPGGGAAAWRTFDARPRFVTNGIGLRNRIGVLSEAYSYLSFERRVQVTGAFMEALLGQVSRRGPAIERLLADIDRDTAASGGRGTLGPLGTSGRLAPLDGAVPVLVGDVETRINPRSGRQMTVMKESVVRRQLMQDYGFFEPVDAKVAPKAYAIPADGTKAADKVAALLALHGIRTERVADATAMTAEVTVPGNVDHAPRSFQGHLETHLLDVHTARRELTLPAGSLLVPMDQPLARLAFHLLEPTSDDGMIAWNLLDDWVSAGKDVPIYRVLPAGSKRQVAGVHPITGRHIAQVMSHLGADWLDRPEREREEAPARAVELLKLRPGNVVADVGAGSGYMTVLLARVVGPSGRVFAVDIQPEMLARLETRVRADGLSNVTPVLGTPDDPKLADGSIDLALMVDVYHELASPQVVLRHLRRALRRDGRLVLVEYRKEDPSVPIREEHKMTVADAKAEVEADGFRLSDVKEDLPRQHVLIFTRTVD